MFILCIIFDARDLKTDLLRVFGQPGDQRFAYLVTGHNNSVVCMLYEFEHPAEPSPAASFIGSGMGFTGLATWFCTGFLTVSRVTGSIILVSMD